MRLFLAVELCDAARREIEAVQDRLRPRLAGWRWVRPHGIHLTIRFLGAVSDADDARLRSSWFLATAGSPPVRFRPGGLAVFPPRGSPRVLWLGVLDTGPPAGLTILADRLEIAAREIGLAASGRAFRPHLTLARAQRGHRAQRPTQANCGTIQETVATEVVLFRSDLSPQGARYTALERFPLRG